MMCQHCNLKPIQTVVTIQGAAVCGDCAFAAIPGEVSWFASQPRPSTGQERALEWLRLNAANDVEARIAPLRKVA